MHEYNPPANYKYNPRISSEAGEPLEVVVDLPENATPDEMFDAIHEAAKLAGLDGA